MRDAAEIIGPVARELWGTPNERLSTTSELRWGDHGGRMVRLDKGTWADHAGGHGSINSGGVLDLIARETGVDHKGAFNWLQQHGFEVDDSTPRANGHSKSLGREVEAYDYVDENGDPLFQVVRYDPKEFRQRRRDAEGKWSWSVRGVRQVPYRLPDLIEALALSHPVFVVEGEKDVDNLRAAGIPATCNAGGAGKWRRELCEFFANADVIVLQDNDPQAKAPDGTPRFHPDGRPVLPGQDHAQDVAKQLSEFAARVRIVDLAKLWPEMPPKADVSDWLTDASGTADKLYAAADKTPAWTAAPFASKFGAQRWEQIGAASAAVHYAWLVEYVVPLGEITLAFGDPGSGKSFDIFDMSVAVARDIKWNGFNVEPGLVIYVAAEAGKGFAKRKAAYMIQHGIDPSEPLPFVLLTKRPDFFHDDTDVTALIEEITAISRSYSMPLVLIVVDTLSAIAPGMNENASGDVSMVRKRLVMLQDKFSAAIMLVHHKPKDGNTPRGHGSLTGDFETTIEFETLGDRLRATVRKQREGKKGISWEFTLPVVEVGQNKWGNPETSCVVQPHQGSARAANIGFHATPTEMLFMRALYDALGDHPLPPPAGLPKAITKVVEQCHVRALMRERSISSHEDGEVSNGRFRVAFKRAGDKLRDGGVIGIQGALLWSTGKAVNGFSGPVIESGVKSSIPA